MAQARTQYGNHDRGTPRRRFQALLGALAICLLVAAPVLAAQGPTKLEQPLVSPTTGTPTTPITAEVTYRNHSDKAPQYVRVVVGSAVHAMAATGPLNYRDGVRYRWTGTLAVGSYAITFEAADFEKFVDQLAAGTVVISAPPPDPTPPPPPKPDPTPRPDPAPSPAPAPTPGGGSGSGGGTTGPVGPVTTPGPVVGAGEIDDGRGGSNDSPADAGAGDWANGTVAAAMTWDGGDGSSGPSGGTGGDGGAAGLWGRGGSDGVGNVGGPANLDPLLRTVEPRTGVSFLAGVAAFFHGIGADPVAALLPGGGGTTLPTFVSAVGSTAAVGVWMAFSLFGKRRRDEELPAPEAVLQAAAAAGLGLVPSSGLVPELQDPELLMPRWRRPSLLLARKVDPIREGLPERQSLSFGRDTATTNERRLIRYATVRLLDRPDEVMGLAVGDLASGDEVELCERSGLFWFVRAPDGRAGWLHRMTLGDQVSPGIRATA